MMTPERRYEERIEHLTSTPVIPVTDSVDREQSRQIAYALEEAGIPVVEFAARYDGVLDSIEAVADDTDYNGLVGIGSVHNHEQAADAIDAGADFVVSHYAPEDVVATCHTQHVPAVLGGWTPTEIEDIRHREDRPDIIKWYPAAAGGPETLEQLLGPIKQDISFLASGGIAPDNATAYIEAGADAVAYGISEPDDYDAVKEEADSFLEAVNAANTEERDLQY